MLTDIIIHLAVAVVSVAWGAYRAKPRGQSAIETIKVVLMGPRPTTPK